MNCRAETLVPLNGSLRGAGIRSRADSRGRWLHPDSSSGARLLSFGTPSVRIKGAGGRQIGLSLGSDDRCAKPPFPSKFCSGLFNEERPFGPTHRGSRR